jgi:cytidine deaminase
VDSSALITLAEKAAIHAYSPYSNYKVGAALITEAGNIYTGCNVENASYGLTICAERNAIFQAVAAEGAGMKIRSLAVIALGHEFPPCGACRQVISEFAQPRTSIHFIQKGAVVSLTSEALLPGAFGLNPVA